MPKYTVAKSMRQRANIMKAHMEFAANSIRIQHPKI